MVSFQVRAASLGEVAGLIEQVRATFDAHVESVQTTVSSVTGSSWTGDDSTDFLKNWDAWKLQAGDVADTLTGLAMQLKSAEGSYSSTEGGLNSGFAALQASDSVVVQAVTAVSTNVGDGKSLYVRQEQAQEARAAQQAAASTAVAGAAGTVATGRSAQRKAEAQSKTPTLDALGETRG